ncbi:MAG: MsnO8 family LLM class oxidoreductase, partial [Microbacteriaceae bacterium]
MTVSLSVLDLVPVRTDQTTAQAVAASRRLVQVADRLGYRRYWVAEHHNMPAVASTNPATVLALIAGASARIRLGSGGVMLPNHTPLAVAEQFALLEASFPGRVDLGIGRAPGSDPVTNWALRDSNRADDAVNRFPEHVRNVLAMLAPEGAGLSLPSGQFELRATPRATGMPPVWLLGSSEYSAQMAAKLGLPYVVAHHFFGTGTAEALAHYRKGFTPSRRLAEPRAFVTANAVVAATAEEADELARPHQLAMAALRAGVPPRAQLTVQEARAAQPAMPEHLL